MEQRKTQFDLTQERLKTFTEAKSNRNSEALISMGIKHFGITWAIFFTRAIIQAAHDYAVFQVNTRKWSNLQMLVYSCKD